MSKMDLVEIFKKRTRSPFRPRASDIVDKLFPDFTRIEVPGVSLVAGTCEFLGKRLYVIGQQKPKPSDLQSKEDLKRLNYGMLTADEHSCILSLLKEAAASDPEKTFVFCIIDTYGADISMESAQHFQAFFIAHLIREFLNLPVRTVSLVLGEGGSGGALAIQVTDLRGQMEDALYATAPPESMASIVFRDPTRISDALTILKPTARELRSLNVIDRILPAARNVADRQETADHVKNFLVKAIKELSRVETHKLIKRREVRARKHGLQKGTGMFYDFKRYIEMPIRKAFLKAPPHIKIVNYTSVINVSDDYRRAEQPETKQFIECGSLQGQQKRESGCGKLIPLKEFLESFHVCPWCGHSYILGAEGWIDCFADPESFHELYRNLTVDQLLEEDSLTDYYRDFLARQEGRSNFKESLVVGSARMHHFQVVMAISEFYYCGGSMGVVFGEKFRRAVDYAIQENLPLISVCCSGGARLYEGISALMQMAKTVEAVNRLKKQGLPYISILADPATGGAIASYAALGDVTLAEPGALVIFAGPRVMQSSGFEVDEKKLVRSDSLHQISLKIYEHLDYYHEIRGIQEISERKNMKFTVAKYLELYRRTNQRMIRKAGGKGRRSLLF